MSLERPRAVADLIRDLHERFMRSEDIRTIFGAVAERASEFLGGVRIEIVEATSGREGNRIEREVAAAGGRAAAAKGDHSVLAPLIERTLDESAALVEIGGRFSPLSRCDVSFERASMPMTLGRKIVGVFALDGNGTSLDRAAIESLTPLLDAAAIAVKALQDARTVRCLELQDASFFHLSHDLMCVADMSGRFTRMNPAFEAALGRSEKDLCSRPFFDFVHPDDQAVTHKALSRLDSGEHVIDFENRYLAADGSILWLSWRATPSPETGEIYAVARNITAEKAAAEHSRHLEELVGQAQKLESLGVLAGGIAHDFNDLLLAILGNADLALMELAPTTCGRSHIEDVVRIAQRASDLCNQMLAYSGRARLEVQTVCLSRVVEEMARLLEIAISKKAALRFDFDRSLPQMRCDPTQLRQILMNLITNASDAIGDEQGTITIRTSRWQVDPASVQEWLGHAPEPGRVYVRADVIDTGCGMDEESRRRMFEPFYSTKFTGRGLGLSAVLGILRDHQGAISVRSTVKVGTTVSVVFPACGETAAPSKGPNGSEPIWNGRGRRVLVVDDEPSIRTLTRKILEQVGFEVETASDGRAALDLVRSHPRDFSAILLDMSMPQLGGVEVLNALRTSGIEIPAVMSSGYARDDAFRRLQSDRACGFIQKPYRPRELIEKLREVIGE